METKESPILRLKNWSVELGGRQVVSDISLEVPPRSMVSIIGPNGSGKSTLLKSLLRFHKGRGEAILAGRALETYRPRDLAEVVAYVPQEGLGPLSFRVTDFLLSARYRYQGLFRRANAEDYRAVDEALSLCNLEQLAERSIDALSGGERQKVLLASAVAQGAKVLFLDEPATFLDPDVEESVFRLLLTLQREKGLSIVVVTHDLNRALLAGTHILALKNGRQVYFGPREEQVQDKILPQVFGLSFLFVTHPESGALVILPRSFEEAGSNER